MVVQQAPKAKIMVAFTLNRGYNPPKVTLPNGTVDCILAIWGWAPFEIFLVVDICPSEECLITIEKEILVSILLLPS